MKRNTLLLITGIVLTVLFIIFSTTVLEAMYYEDEFSVDMYNQNLYFIVAVISAVEAWAFAGIYYYVINSVSFSRWYHWLLVLAIAAVSVPIEIYVYLNGAFDTEGVSYSSQLLSFSVVVMVVEALLFVLASYSVRWWSSNCRHTPIPE